MRVNNPTATTRALSVWCDLGAGQTRHTGRSVFLSVNHWSKAVSRVAGILLTVTPHLRIGTSQKQEGVSAAATKTHQGTNVGACSEISARAAPK